MPQQITFVQPSGERRSIDVEAGATVMLTAVAHGIPGILAECGGSAMCATCHVYVDESSISKLSPISEVEHEMLDSAASSRKSSSRLSCQLTIPADAGEIVVHIPSRQV